MFLVRKNTKIFKGSTLNKADNGDSKKLFYFANIKYINKLMLILFLLILSIGIFNLFTISSFYAVRQIIFVIISIPLVVLIVMLNPRYFIKFAHVIFFISLLLLCSVLVFGDVSMGARRWIDLRFLRFQPSEVSKLATIIAIARFYHFVKEIETEKLKSAIIPLMMIVLQIALILKQPDLGTSLTLLFLGLSIIFLAGLKFRYFIIAGIFCIFMLPVLWNNLHNYQKQRIKTFLNPEEDSLGTGYNITQAKIAIGSGGFFGKGMFEGTQGNLDFLPESHTDFAFTIFAEQFGFVGSIFLILLYIIIILYGFNIAISAESHFVRITSSGISCLFFLHIIINLSMTSGLIPVVGNPLPLLSYGGTFLILNIISFSILLNLDVNKKMVIHSSKESYMQK